MRGVNKATLLGNLGGDPEVRYMQDGTAIASFSVATTDKWKDKDGNEQERTEWHAVRAFGRLAEVCGEYLHKGDPVYVEGSIRHRKVTGNDGTDKYFTDIRVDSNGVIRFLGGKRDGERRTSPPRPQQQRTAPRQSAPEPAAADDFADDDIPF